MFKDLKQKIKDHKDEIFVGTVFATLIGGAIALGIWSNKQMQKEIDEALARGDLVVRIPNGDTIIIPKEMR